MQTQHAIIIAYDDNEVHVRISNMFLDLISRVEYFILIEPSLEPPFTNESNIYYG